MPKFKFEPLKMTMDSRSYISARLTTFASYGGQEAAPYIRQAEGRGTAVRRDV